MEILQIAVLLTVYNRKETTLKALSLLHKVISKYNDINFDIFMVDDGCTDGTVDEVKLKFPKVYIHKGNGQLYWSGGMHKAWEIATATADYDYFIWFNDDAMLYDNALDELLAPMKEFGNDIIISGAFVDDSGNASYGGRNKNGNILSPDGTLQEIFLMNGNWVIIPKQVKAKIGLIDKVFKHSFGDWDYGCRARKAGIRVLLTKSYVGRTNRHDGIPAPYDNQFSLKRRIKFLFHCKYSPYLQYIFAKRHYNIIKAIYVYFSAYIYMLCPFLYKIRHKSNCRLQTKMQ